MIGKDYRGYDKEYKGRAYKFIRIVQNTWVHLSRSWWSRSILIISAFFVFIQVMFFLFGANNLASSSEDFFNENNDVRFDIRPIENETYLQEVPLGGSATFTYEITNVGNEWGRLEIYAQAPNSYWKVYTRIEPDDIEFPSGQTKMVYVDVFAPDNMEEYLFIEPDNMSIDDLQLPSLEDIDLSDLSSLGSMAAGLMSQLGGMPNTYEEYNTTRAIKVYAFYKDWDDDLPLANKMADVRTSSIFSFVQVSKEDVINTGWDSGTDLTHILDQDSNFNIRIEKFDNDNAPVPSKKTDPLGLNVEENQEAPLTYARKSLKAGKFADFNVIINNTGNVSVKVQIDVIIMQSRDAMWYWEAFGLQYDLTAIMSGNFEDLDMGRLKGFLEVRAGRERNFTLRVHSSNMSIRKPFNVMVIGTDIENPNYQYTNASLCVVRVNKVIETDNAKESFYNLLWGGDFNYERYLWLIFLSSVAGAGLLANDKRYNSISLYLSRPITKIDYVLGKALALFLFLWLVTIVPALILYGAGILMESVSIDYIVSHLWILGSIFLSYFFVLTVFTSVSLALSSITKKWMYAGIGIFSFFFFSSILSDVLYLTFGSDYLKLISIRTCMRILIKFIFNIHYDVNGYGFDWYYPAGVIAGIFLASVLLIAYRMYRSELSE